MMSKGLNPISTSVDRLFTLVKIMILPFMGSPPLTFGAAIESVLNDDCRWYITGLRSIDYRIVLTELIEGSSTHS